MSTEEQAPTGYEWVCSECGRHATDKAVLREPPSSCAAWAVLCPVGSGAAVEYDAVFG